MQDRLKKLDVRLAGMNETSTELAGQIGARADARKAMEDRQVAVAETQGATAARLAATQEADRRAMVDTDARLLVEQKATAQALAETQANERADMQARNDAMVAEHTAHAKAAAEKVARQQEAHAAELKAFDVVTVALVERRKALKDDYGHLFEMRGLLVKALDEASAEVAKAKSETSTDGE